MELLQLTPLQAHIPRHTACVFSTSSSTATSSRDKGFFDYRQAASPLFLTSTEAEQCDSPVLEEGKDKRPTHNERRVSHKGVFFHCCFTLVQLRIQGKTARKQVKRRDQHLLQRCTVQECARASALHVRDRMAKMCTRMNQVSQGCQNVHNFDEYIVALALIEYARQNYDIAQKDLMKNSFNSLRFK